MKTKNKMTIVIILALIIVLLTAFSGMTAFAADEEPTPTPPTEEETLGGLFAGLWETVKDFFYSILGNIALFILWLVDCLFALIGVLAGSGVVSGEKGILESLLAEEAIKNALFGITALGAVLVLIIGALAVFRRSTSDQHGAVGTVVKNMLKAIALFIAVPMLCIALIFIVNLLVQGINLAISGGKDGGSFGSMIFSAGYNLPDAVSASFFKKEMPFEMYTVEGLKMAFKNAGENSLNVQAVNWLIILVGGGALLWFCFPMILMLVSRLFELVILYIFDAIPIAFMPYDDGERFNHWKNEFVERFMSAYGVVLSYSLFGMLMPTIMGMGFIAGNSFFKIIIILGGAYFMNKAPTLINGLLGLKNSGIGDALDGIAMRQSLGAGVKLAGGAALGAGALAIGKTASIVRGVKNKIAPSGSARAEKVLDRQDKLERQRAKLEQKRDKNSDGYVTKSSVIPISSSKTSGETSKVANTATSAKDGTSSSSTDNKNNISRKTKVYSPRKATTYGHRQVNVKKEISVPVTKKAMKIDKKLKKNGESLLKNQKKIRDIRKEVERNSLISGAGNRKNWNKAKAKRKNWCDF